MRTILFKPKTLNLTLAIVVLTLTVVGTVFPQALAITSNQFVPFAQANFVPCANGGAGEFVLVEGTLHIQQHITINDNTINLKSHFQPQEAAGIGLITGDTYQTTGVTQLQDTIPVDTNGAGEFTFVNNFRLIGQGPDNNFQVHQNIHVTITPNDDVTTVVDNTSVDCN